MNDEQLLTLVSTILAILLVISELLGMSNCNANSILQVLGKIGCQPPRKQEERSSTPSLPQES
jgi:hypothetical protein